MRKNERFAHSEFTVAFTVFLLGGWGILTIVSSQAEAAEPLRLVGRQFGFFLIGLAIMWGAWRIPFDWYRRSVWKIAAIAYLATILLPLAGTRVNGMCGWYRLGTFMIQPSELAKAVFLLGGAVLLCRFREDWKRFSAGGVWALLWSIPLLFQPDFGTTVVYLGGFAILFFLAGGGWSKILAVGGVGIAAAVWFISTHAYAWNRFVGLYSNSADPLGSGWHVRQLELAIARGGLFGAKLGGAYWSNAYVPLAYNDSAFATMLETLGWVGAFPALLAGGVLVWGLCHLATRPGLQPDARLMIAGSGFLVALQGMLHISVNVCLLPPTGLTMPLVSYGGSSLIGCCLMFGMALSAAGEKKERRE